MNGARFELLSFRSPLLRECSRLRALVFFSSAYWDVSLPQVRPPRCARKSEARSSNIRNKSQISKSKRSKRIPFWKFKIYKFENCFGFRISKIRISARNAGSAALSAAGVSPFGDPGIKSCWPLPPGLSQAYRVLHRLPVPRHPPSAYKTFTLASN